MSSHTTTAVPSAEEAARKAREIAAKLLGGSSNDTTSAVNGSAATDSAGATTGKRKRWGVAPSTTATTATTAASLPGWDQVAKKMKQDSEPVQKRVWITSTSKDRPAWHYVTYMSPKFPDLATQAQKEHGNGDDSSKTKVEIKFKGRGSSRQPALPGIPEEPLHVFLEGPEEMVEAAETMVEDLLQEAERAEVTVDVTQEEEFQNDPSIAEAAAHSMNDQQLALMANAGGGGAGGHYRPASVAQLIGQTHQAHNAANIPMTEWESEDLQVPNGVVGFIIGRGGETITSMQARTGTLGFSFSFIHSLVADYGTLIC